ncbi:MAG: double-stranded DNA-binding protein [Thermoprotei archaeon]|nr:MAG: double-stranded DNA-binding protein [Thermoprotei archaeon]
MRKLLELQRKMVTEKEKKDVEEDPRSIVVKHLAGRGIEVLEAAEAQFPEATKLIVRELARLIKQGKVVGSITGEELYGIFLSLGLRVRMPTKIYYEKKGERKGLSELLRERMKKN